jgi:hypothetical protein
LGTQTDDGWMPSRNLGRNPVPCRAMGFPFWAYSSQLLHQDMSVHEFSTDNHRRTFFILFLNHPVFEPLLQTDETE